MLVADKIYINGNSTFGINQGLFDNITVSVSPSASLLYAGQRQQFTATTNSADTAVTWTISPAGVGTVSASGLYTAPDTISAQQTVAVDGDGPGGYKQVGLGDRHAGTAGHSER